MTGQFHDEQAITRREVGREGMPVRRPPEAMQEQQRLANAIRLIVQRQLVKGDRCSPVGSGVGGRGQGHRRAEGQGTLANTKCFGGVSCFLVASLKVQKTVRKKACHLT
jgi:hypothetical protein